MKYFLSAMKLTLIAAGMISAVVLFFILVFLARLPSKNQIRGCITTKMYSVNLCPGSNNYVKLSQIPAHLRSALLLSEDASFFTHNGFDFQEMQNSLEKNMKLGKYARGGSTITQQLAKNLFLTKEKTVTRKILEAVITLKIERTLSKNEILERYLNVVQFGKGIFGIKSAAQHYFSKPPSELDLLESAFLVFLLPSPEVYSKSFYKKKLTPFATKRLNQIISKMYVTGRISEDSYDDANLELSSFLSGETVEEDLSWESIPDEESAAVED